MVQNTHETLGAGGSHEAFEYTRKENYCFGGDPNLEINPEAQFPARWPEFTHHDASREFASSHRPLTGAPLSTQPRVSRGAATTGTHPALPGCPGTH